MTVSTSITTNKPVRRFRFPFNIVNNRVHVIIIKNDRMYEIRQSYFENHFITYNYIGLSTSGSVQRIANKLVGKRHSFNRHYYIGSFKLKACTPHPVRHIMVLDVRGLPNEILEGFCEYLSEVDFKRWSQERVNGKIQKLISDIHELVYMFR